MAHAKLSPSAAERWMTCAGSVRLSEGIENVSSKYAEEGTEAHALAENMLRGKAYRAEPSMVENVRVYTDYVISLTMGSVHPHFNINCEWFLEQQVKVNDSVWGTADAIVWDETQRILHVVDLKYGAGVAVEVVDNLQLKIYALAALLTFGFAAEKVTVAIVQPRCPHSDGPIRSVTFEVVDLLEFNADLEDAVARVELAYKHNDLEPFLVPSEKGCRWCLAAFKCPKLRNAAQDQAKKVFAPNEPYDPKSLAETLDFLPILEGWIKNVREFAYREAEKGRTAPGYKLVEKRSHRKWRDEATALAALSIYLDDDELLSKPELNSPAAIEKLLPKDIRVVLDELTVKESSGHALVHESDKRQAVSVDAKTVFANV